LRQKCPATGQDFCARSFRGPTILRFIFIFLAAAWFWQRFIHQAGDNLAISGWRFIPGREKCFRRDIREQKIVRACIDEENSGH
jgi:hypothetical protein